MDGISELEYCCTEQIAIETDVFTRCTVALVCSALVFNTTTIMATNMILFSQVAVHGATSCIGL